MNTCTHGRTHACTHTHTHTHIQIPFLTVLMMKLYTYHYLVSSLSIIMYSAKVQLFQFQVKMWRKINSPVFDRPTLSLSLEMWQWRHCVWHGGGFEHPGMTVKLTASVSILLPQKLPPSIKYLYSIQSLT